MTDRPPVISADEWLTVGAGDGWFASPLRIWGFLTG